MDDTRHMQAAELRALFDQAEPEDYQLIDIRQPPEYASGHIPGARLLSMPDLPNRLDTIDRHRPVILYCRSGNRSWSALQFLAEQGFGNIRHLAGGIIAWNGGVASGPAGLGMMQFSGQETAAELNRLASSMEFTVARFYEEKSRQFASSPLASLFTDLAAVENSHGQMLASLAESFEEKTGEDQVTEGGIRLAEFIAASENHLRSPSSVIRLAMMIELQAIDLYHRFHRLASLSETRVRLHQLIQEEKTHLTQLGVLLDSLNVERKSSK